MKKLDTSGITRVLLTLALSLGLGTLIMLILGYNPVDAFVNLFRGAFVGSFRFGNLIASFTPLLLTATAFAIAAQGGAFNVGVEGQVFLGAITAAYIGINWTFLPAPLLIIACFLGAMVIGGSWALIPAVLKAYYNVSEVCVTILMNMVALFITSYLVSGPMSAGTANAQTEHVAVRLPRFLAPSNANAGIFIAIAVVVVVCLLLYKTKYGFKIRMTGQNPTFADFSGVNSKSVFINGMILSGMIAGIAGTIEVLGVYGFFLNNFAAGLGINGMLAALIAKSSLILSPFLAFFLAILHVGSLGMQQATGIPRALIDVITATFIIIASMETLFQLKKRLKKKKNNGDSEGSGPSLKDKEVSV